MTAGVVEGIEAAKPHPPLRHLLLYLNAGDSLFSTLGSGVWSEEAGGSDEAFLFGSRVDLIFCREDANLTVEYHKKLALQLAALLGKETDSLLRVELQVRPPQVEHALIRFCLHVAASAQGQTMEQAKLRWGLGLAHVQQAILFAARGLRRELGEQV